MRPVIIVQGASSAYLYVQECRNRGLEPIILNPPLDNQDRKAFVKKTGGNVRTIGMRSDDEYDSVLDKIRKLDPLCVVCGSTAGTYITDRMARDLGLRGNDPDTTWRRDTKSGMHQSLKEAGIRYIRSALVKSEKDIDRFWKSVKPKKVMMKFDTGAASVGNKVCFSADEAKSYYNEMLGGHNVYGVFDTPLIQEFIEGEEYIVDTVSCNGKHTVTDIWVYRKVLTKDNDLIYDDMSLVTRPTPGMTELILYAYDVLDATGFEYGPCHGEFKIDDRGPVLIETNARPVGGAMNAEFLDECLGHHITDIALDAYIDPDAFMARLNRPYRPRKDAKLMFMFSPEDRGANLYPLRKILNGLDSYRATGADLENRTVRIAKTIDLETSPVAIKLCHSDYEVISKEKGLLYLLETQYPYLAFPESDRIKGHDRKIDMQPIIDMFPLDWKVLAVTSKGEYMVRYGRRIDAADHDKCDLLIFADASKDSLSQRISDIMDAVSRVNCSGFVVILPDVYEGVPYGATAMEVILSVCGCRTEVPRKGYLDAVCATKE